MDESIKSASSDFDGFLQCRLCNKGIVQPKFLPCFHRFCLRCIEQYTKDTSESTSFKCPECETEFQIGKSGVTGLQADRYSESLIQCLQLQRSLRDTQQIKECFCCSQGSASAAYCFKCPGFLCNSCLHIHENNRVAKDHKAFMKVLSGERGDIAIEELLRLTGVPRCKTHPSETERLSCESCNGKNICVECWSHEHASHKIVSVDKTETECAVKVGELLDSLTQHITQISNFVKTEEKSSEEAKKTMQEEKGQLKLLQEDIRKIIKVVQVEDSKIEEKKKLLISAEEAHIQELKREMEQKIDKIKEKYERQFDERRKETQVRVQELEKSRNKEFTEKKNQLVKKVVAIKKSVKQKTEYLRSAENTRTKIQRFTVRFEILKERLCSLQRTANSWVSVRDSLSIESAINVWVQELEEDYPRIFSKTTLGDEILIVNEEIEMTVQEEATVNIRYPGGYRQHLVTMTGLPNGHVIILSKKTYHDKDDPDRYYAIIADIKGEMLTQKELKAFSSVGSPNNQLAVLQRDQGVICVYFDYEKVVLINVKDFSYTTKSTEEITSQKSGKCYTSCMTTDQKNKLILFCIDEKVYVTDSELCLRDSFRLSYSIGRCDAIALLNQSIFTCDTPGKKAFALTTKGDLRHRLVDPQITACQWIPRKLCTDGNKYVYILWEGGRNGNIVVQYEEDNADTLAIRRVHEGFEYFDLLRVKGEQKLVLWKRDDRVLLIYGFQPKFQES